MGVHHWPGCNGNHEPGTGCNGGHGDRVKAIMAAEDAPIVVRRPDAVAIVYLAEETIPAGGQAEVNPATGMLRNRRT